MDDPEKLEMLTVKEVAAIAKVTTHSINRWVRQGAFPAPIRIGALKRWPRHEVVRAFEEAPRAA